MATLYGAGMRLSSGRSLYGFWVVHSSTASVAQTRCGNTFLLSSIAAQRVREQTTDASSSSASPASPSQSSTARAEAIRRGRIQSRRMARQAKAKARASKMKSERALKAFDDVLPPTTNAKTKSPKQSWLLRTAKNSDRRPKGANQQLYSDLSNIVQSISSKQNDEGNGGEGAEQGESKTNEESRSALVEEKVGVSKGRQSLQSRAEKKKKKRTVRGVNSEENASQDERRHSVLSWNQPRPQDASVSKSEVEESSIDEGGAKKKYLWPDVVTSKANVADQSPFALRASTTHLFTGKEALRKRKLIAQTDVDENADEEFSQTLYVPSECVPVQGSHDFQEWNRGKKWTTSVGGKLSADDVPLETVPPLRKMDVPQLAHGLDRVLFNPGVHWLRDKRSGIYNFNPKLRDLYDVDLFDYSALPPYQTSSVDPELAELAKKHSKPYSGSTSSLTALLSQIYFAISAWRAPPLKGFSEGFQKKMKGFAFGAKLPANVFLKKFTDANPDDGEKVVRYAVDSAKTVMNEPKNVNYVLTQLGKSVEKMLTATSDEYEKYLRVNSHVLSEQEKNKKEAYYYSMTDKFMLRSQLDCSDDRLPRQSFDLKTRAVVAVRMDRANWVESSGYTLRHNTGVYESFEREMWDLSRGTLLKYFFQARIGNMDGILVAYHSTSTMFGFQYLSREELAERLFGSEEMGEQAFKLCIGMLERILDSATSFFPDESLHITMDAQAKGIRRDPSLEVYVRPESSVKEVEEEEAEATEDASGIDPSKDGDATKADEMERATKEEGTEGRTEDFGKRRTLLLRVDFDRYLSDSLVQGPVNFEAPKGYRIDPSSEDEIKLRERKALPALLWSLEYSITPCTHLSEYETKVMLDSVLQRPVSASAFQLPNIEALNERERARQEALQVNPEAWKKFLEDRRTGVAAGMPPAPGQVIMLDDDADAAMEGEEASEAMDAWTEMTEEEDEEGRTSVKVMHDHKQGSATVEEDDVSHVTMQADGDDRVANTSAEDVMFGSMEGGMDSAVDQPSVESSSFGEEQEQDEREREHEGEEDDKHEEEEAGVPLKGNSLADKRQLPPHLQSDSVTWVRTKGDTVRLRKLAQLGQQDRDELAKTDEMKQYERRGD